MQFVSSWAWAPSAAEAICFSAFKTEQEAVFLPPNLKKIEKKAKEIRSVPEGHSSSHKRKIDHPPGASLGQVVDRVG